MSSLVLDRIAQANNTPAKGAVGILLELADAADDAGRFMFMFMFMALTESITPIRFNKRGRTVNLLNIFDCIVPNRVRV